MTPRRVGLVLRIVLLLAAFIDARFAHGADEAEAGESDLLVWGTDDQERPWSAWIERSPSGARVTARTTGIVLAARGALWRWKTTSMQAPARLSCEFDGAMNGHGTGTVIRASLERVGPGRRRSTQVVVRPPFAAARQTAEYSHHVELEGSVGSLLFVTDQAYDYTCGAHGGVSSGFRVWDAEHDRTVDVHATIPAAERAALLQRAREALADDPDLGGGPDNLPAARDVHPSRLAPVFGPDGRLRLAHWFWMDTCYACGDGEWDSYTRSARVEGSALPDRLGGYARIEGLAGLIPSSIRGVARVPRSLEPTFLALPRE